MNPDCRYCGFKDDKPHECFPKEARDVIDERTSWYHDQWQQAHDLQKLCEEQRVERDYYIGNAIYLSDTLKRVMDEKTKIESQVEEQRGEIERLKFGAEVRAEIRAISDPYTEFQEGRMSKQAFISAISGPFESQLATQTERVRVLTEAIEEASRRIQSDTLGETGGPLEVLEQALNQDRLGDGGKEPQCMNPEWHKLNDGKWRHIVMVDGKLYFDGAEVVEKQG